MNLQEKVKNLPSSPGVYLMKDSEDKIIYVGKAKNLKRRVKSYFHNIKSHSPKTKKLVYHVKDFDIRLTDTEFEAFMLECSLIREFKPYYNKKMKNPLAYTYIVIERESFDKIHITNQLDQRTENIYFGPYPNKSTVERAIKVIKEFYKIDCTSPSKKISACLNYSLGLCIGMCINDSANKHYDNIINKIIALLNGSDMSIIEELQQKMVTASEKFDFETAMKYRDSIELIKFLINREKVTQFTEDNKNITVIEYLTDTTFKLFLIKRNKILYSEKFELKNNENDHLLETIKSTIYHYFKSTPILDSTKISRDEIDEAQIIYSYLKGSSSNHWIIPQEWINTENNEKLTEVIKKNLKPLIS